MGSTTSIGAALACGGSIFSDKRRPAKEIYVKGRRQASDTGVREASAYGLLASLVNWGGQH